MNYLNSDGLQHLWSKIVNALSGKQDVLRAGERIHISDGVISSDRGVGVDEIYIGSNEPDSNSSAVLWFNPEGKATAPDEVYATKQYVQDNYILKTDAESNYTLKTYAEDTYAKKTDVPTSTSQLQNDSDYTTRAYVNQAISNIDVGLTSVPDATSTTVGGITIRMDGTTLYIRNDGGQA